MDWVYLVKRVLESDKKVVIEFGNQVGVGKTFLAFKLAKELKVIYGIPCYVSSFASCLKQILYSIDISKDGKLSPSYDEEEFINYYTNSFSRYVNDIQKLKNLIETYKEGLIEGFYTYLKDYKNGFRKIAQITGTEIGRNLDYDFWVKLTKQEIDSIFFYSNIRVFIIDDYRFPNELIKDNKYYTYAVKVNTSSYNVCKRLSIPLEQLEKIREHTSENQKLHFDIEIDNNKELFF